MQATENASTDAAASRQPRPRTGPLAGVRVADFCWVGVGACATRLLADFGAQVIKIEDRGRLDRTRRLPVYKGGGARTYGHEDANPDPNRSGVFNNYNRNKLGITLNMKSPRGRELAQRLIRQSQVVTENFAPGVMERWGLTYDRLKELRPDIIFARMSGYGHVGPHSEYRSYGPTVQAVCGQSFISGLPGKEPSGWGLSYMDNQAAYYNSAALLAAIFHHMRTGEGTEIDVSAVEAGIKLLGPILLDVTANGRVTRTPDFPTGNRLEQPQAAPHGVYPCAGSDRWLAIAVFNQDEWLRLVAALGHPHWASDPRFATQAQRFDHQDALDAEMARWSVTLSPHEAMALLQANGVRAAAVQTAQDVNDFDPQIAHRGVFFEMDHPVIGPARFEGTPIHFSALAPDNWRSAPLLGEDNAYVFKGILGMDEAEYQELQAEGVIGQ